MPANEHERISQQRARIGRRKKRRATLVRFFDVALAGGALLIGLPGFLLVAIAIYISDPGPIFFRQIRIGRWGRPFWMYKFRSMYTDAEARKSALQQQNQHGSAGVTFKMKDDPRIFWVGKWIRRLSVDELPQILNILRGEMSIVGPRPAVPREVALYSQRQRLRLEAKPGLTCYWQVRGRADIPFEEQVDLDLEYILAHDFGTNIRLVFETVPAVLTGKGAY